VIATRSIPIKKSGGNGIALVMKSAPAGHTGSTSSLLGVLQYVFADITGAALGLAHDGTLAPFVVGLLLCATGGLIAFVVATRVTIHMAPPRFDRKPQNVRYPCINVRKRRDRSPPTADIRTDPLPSHLFACRIVDIWFANGRPRCLHKHRGPRDDLRQ
jgi:hypothetical protein